MAASARRRARSGQCGYRRSIPVSTTPTPPTKAQLVAELNKEGRLSRTKAPVIFPECAPVLLALATRPNSDVTAPEPDAAKFAASRDEIRKHFDGYFKVIVTGRAQTSPDLFPWLDKEKDALTSCVTACTDTACIALGGDRLEPT